MGLLIALERENGQKITTIKDDGNILHSILPPPEDRRYSLIRFVDWYGDTVFNRIQMPELLDDINNLLEGIKDAENVDVIRSVQKLCEQCRDNVHLYVKFYGD